MVSKVLRLQREVAQLRHKVADLEKQLVKMDQGLEGGDFGFILWNPSSNLPPTQVFPTLSYANRVAEEMAQRHKGQQFLVARLVYARLPLPKEYVLG